MSDDLRELYIDVVKKSLGCSLYEETDGVIYTPPDPARRALLRLLLPRNVRMTWRVGSEQRDKGGFATSGMQAPWPALALTMVGTKRLDNILQCVSTVLEDGVRGDFIETGVWRGGSVILMRAILKAYGVTDRTVFAADSFEGLPKPDADSYPADRGDRNWSYKQFAVSLGQVRANFERYGLLDEQVRFLKGWFKDTLPEAPIERLAVVRLDGDMYESTMTALEALYPKLQLGGFLIVDDYGAARACKQAIEDYRAQHSISEPIETIDWTGVFWRKTR